MAWRVDSRHLTAHNVFLVYELVFIICFSFWIFSVQLIFLLNPKRKKLFVFKLFSEKSSEINRVLKMTGLRKAKKYDWKDSNLALFGSELETNVKKASAETEVAWKGAGQKVRDFSTY